MRATIIVRKRPTDSIAHLVCVDSIDEKTVRDAVEQLLERYSPRLYRIDTSQIQLARQSLAAA